MLDKYHLTANTRISGAKNYGKELTTNKIFHENLS